MLQRFDGARWSQIRVDTPIQRHFYVHALIQSRERELWLATKGAGVIQGTPKGDTYRWVVHDRSSGLASDRVGAIRQTRDGRIWCATSDGVSIYNGNRWQTLNRRDGLKSNQVFAITQTQDQSVWLATLGGGVSRYGPTGWQQIKGRHGLASDNVTGGLLRARDGSIWVGTDQGISILAHGSWRTVRTGVVALDYINHMIQAADGSIWIATRQGTRRFKNGSWRDYPPPPDPGDPSAAGPAHSVVIRLAEDPSGRIWMATAGGISSFDGRSWRRYTQQHGLPSAKINDLLITSGGHIWAATANGLAHLEGDRWIPSFESRPISRMNRIYSLVEDRSGRLWASGLEDVYTRGAAGWSVFHAERWLPAGIYSRFTMGTAEGSLWFAVRGLGLRRLRDGRWTSYSTEDGLAADTVRDVLMDADAFLFGTLGGGISRYIPDTSSPETFIGTGGSSAPGSSYLGEELNIAFGGQDVLKHTRTEELLFSYRLDGGRWSHFSRGTSASFPRLEPGGHRFEVRAMDQDFNVDPTPASHSFRVLRPWYAEPWLLLLVGFTIILAIFATIRMIRAKARERRATTQEQLVLNQRRDFVRLASHELRKPLARMAHRAEMLAQPALLQNQEQVSRYASAIINDSRGLSRMVETLLEQARVEEGLHLELVEADLNELVRQVVAKFSAEEVAPRLDLSPGPLVAAHDPFFFPLALQNLMDNAFKYGGEAGEVRVATRLTADRAEILIQDQGPGVDAEERGRIFEPFFRGKTRGSHGGFGLGLSFARDIARAHGGDLMLRPSPKGAIFCLVLPIKGNRGDDAPAADH